LGELIHDAKFLTFSFEGVSPQVLANQSTRKKTKKSIFQNKPKT
jgi:hypothetical protein